MGRWLRLAAAALALAWAPYMYGELTRETPARSQEQATPAGPQAEPGDDLEPHELPAALPALEDEPMPELPSPAAPPSGAVATPGAEAEPEPEAESEPEPKSAMMPLSALTARVLAGDDEEEEEEEESESEADPDEGGEDDDEPSAPAPQIPASGPLDIVKGVFEGETRDALWASDRETSLTDEFLRAGFADEAVSDVQCMRTVCRMSLQIGAKDLKALSTVYAGFQEAHGSTVAVEPFQAEGANTGITLYIPREGYSLSDLSKP